MEAIRQQYVGEISINGPRGRSVYDASDIPEMPTRPNEESHSTTAPWTGMRLPTFCAFMSLCFVLLFGIAASIAEGQGEDAAVQTAARSGVISVDLESNVAMTQNLDGVWHTVVDSEDLKHISDRYYGSSSHWRMLQVSNDVGRYPAQGTQLWIPASADAWFTQEETAVILLSQDVEEATYDDSDNSTASITTRP